MLEEVKQFLRIEGSEDDNILAIHISAAKLYIKNGSGVIVDETNELHKEVVFLLVYLRSENIPFGEYKEVLDDYFSQLKYCVEEV